MEEKKEVLVIIKFGGSAITEKNTFESLKKNQLDTISEHLATFSQNKSKNGKKFRFIIVHGEKEQIQVPIKARKRRPESARGGPNIKEK